ncbi:TRAUB-domain-containing protein [Cytidiella melzeri]|nr:TRAUB-domain-containing protein [Cytidiella melzeri]
MSARISLAQQIALLSQAAPADLDPEEINSPIDKSATATEHYLQVGPPTIRQTNTVILGDPKYTSTRISRVDLQRDSEPDSSTSSDEDGIQRSDDEVSSGQSDGDTVQPRGHAVQHAPTSIDAEEEDMHPSEVSLISGLAATLRVTREQDRRKGKAIVRQITLWDTLLDARIRLQKSVAALGVVCPSQVFTASASLSVRPSLHRMLEEAVALSNEMSLLQEALLRMDGTPDISLPPRKRAKLSHTDERDYEAELRTLSVDSSAFEAAYHRHLVQTLAKWSAKIQAVAPSVLLPASRSSFRSTTESGKMAANSGVVNVIDALLTSDPQKLVARTQAYQNETAGGNTVGADKDNTDKSGETATFDDTDFYQQLLRDVIESHGTDGEIGKQEWIRRQKANKANKRKTVDTRASKGRKLRYQIHEKLQNFMVPVPTSHVAWHHEQIDELFASLVGN